MTIKVEDIVSLIPEKDAGLITAKRISKILGCDESTVRKIIHAARSNGVPICSKQLGYYYSEDAADIADTVRFLRGRVRTQLRAIDGLENTKYKEDIKK